MENRVLTLLKARHASRSIKTDPLPVELVAELIEAARLTPSCFNNQPWRYLFLTGEEALAKGRGALAPGNLPWAGRAPLLIVGYSKKENDCVMGDGRAYHEFDLGMSVMMILLAASDRDLVARPMAGFSPEKLVEEFALAEGEKPLVMIAVGKLSEDESHVPEHARGVEQKPRVRKPVDEIVKRL